VLSIIETHSWLVRSELRMVTAHQHDCTTSVVQLMLMIVVMVDKHHESGRIAGIDVT